MEPAGSPVTVRDGDFSSPDAPRGTGEPKSKKDSYTSRSKSVSLMSFVDETTTSKELW